MPKLRGLFPVNLGHEGEGIPVEVVEGVTALHKGDHVIPLYTPECKECKFFLSGNNNLCEPIRATQGKRLRPDVTSHFSKDGKMIPHYMGCSTFAEYTAVPEIALAKINLAAALNKVCLLGCGVTTGIGAVLNMVKVEKGETFPVFGIGGIGLSVIRGAKMSGASKIIAIDINDVKRELAEKYGATDFINPKKYDKPMQQVIV